MGFVSRAMERAIERRFHPSVFDSKLYGFWGGGNRSASGTYVNENTALCKKSGLPCAGCMRGVLDDVTKCPHYQPGKEPPATGKNEPKERE